MKKLNDDRVSVVKKAFPGKYPFSRQDNLFLDRRMRALDAYLQLLIYNLKCGESERASEFFNRFFSIVNQQNPIETVESRASTVEELSVKTPNLLNSELENLKREFHLNPMAAISEFLDDFENLKKKIEVLRDRSELKETDARLVEKFYDFKREWEIEQIKTGIFSKDFLKLKEESGEGKIAGGVKEVKLVKEDEKVPCEDWQRQQIFGQEAILNDLSAVLAEQKRLSGEIYSEIVEQNLAIEGFRRKQEEVMDGFKDSTVKARKLQ